MKRDTDTREPEYSPVFVDRRGVSRVLDYVELGHTKGWKQLEEQKEQKDEKEITEC